MGPKDGVFALTPHGFILPHPHPTLPCMTGKFFLPHPCPFGARKASPHPVKLYFLLICPQLLQLFLIKPISLVKIYLKLQITITHQIKLIFSKTLYNIIKVLNKTTLQQKQKSHNIKSMIQ